MGDTMSKRLSIYSVWILKLLSFIWHLTSKISWCGFCPLSSTRFHLSLHLFQGFFYAMGNLSWQFVTKCSKFINKTMGSIRSQLKEAIKRRILIGLVGPLKHFFCLSFSKSNDTKKTPELVCWVHARPFEMKNSSFMLDFTLYASA